MRNVKPTTAELVTDLRELSNAISEDTCLITPEGVRMIQAAANELEGAENRDVVTPGYLQSWIDKAYASEEKLANAARRSQFWKDNHAAAEKTIAFIRQVDVDDEVAKRLATLEEKLREIREQLDGCSEYDSGDAARMVIKDIQAILDKDNA